MAGQSRGREKKNRLTKWIFKKYKWKEDKGEQSGQPDKRAVLCSPYRSIRLLAPYLSLEITLSSPWPQAPRGWATSIPRQPLFLFWLPASLLWLPAFSTAQLSPQSFSSYKEVFLFTWCKHYAVIIHNRKLLNETIGSWSSYPFPHEYYLSCFSRFYGKL